MIDIHHHIIYGLDDGPADIQAMQRMLKAASQDGVRTIIATPHIAPGIQHFPMNLYYERLLEAQRLCAATALDLRILSGAEIRYTHQTANYLAEGSIPTLGGTNKILLEFPGNVRFETIVEAVQMALRNATVPVLAHIERYRHLIFPVRRAEALKEEYNVFYQINGECILKSRNYRVNRAIRRLLQHKMIDFVASDAHDCDKRPCRMKETYEKLITVAGRDYADKLTGRGSTAEDLLGHIDEQALSNCYRVFRQKSQLKEAARNVR
jgi:protein-tyrosine phosphatase